MGFLLILMTNIHPKLKTMTAVPQLPRPLLDAFQSAFPGQSPDVFVRAPGRVNLLGGHVDNHGGPVINIAINREIWLAANYGTAELVNLYAADMGASVTLTLNNLNDHKDVVGDDLPRWALYPAGVAWALRRRHLKVNGINAAFLGNVTMRAGLSSSAAVEEAFAVAWQALESWKLDHKELAVVGNEVEREYMGIGSGIQDQFTCLHARQDHVLWLDCRSLEHRHTMLPDSVKIVVCDTNTRRELAGSGYTGRAQDAHAAAHTISLVDGDVKSLRDVSLARLAEFESVLTENQFRRARHVVTEIARVEQGFEAINRDDYETFGDIMNQSFLSARNDYGSSSPALDSMWESATAHPGCHGARYSGGGEAGAVVALVATDAVEDFISQTTERYNQCGDGDGEVFVVDPAPGAGVFV
jgi:galactokinase